jgi:hypothetical protein
VHQHRGSFWPFSDSSAFFSSGALLTLLLGAWAVVESLVDLAVPAGWLLLGIAIIGVAPVLLHMLDGVASTGGSIGIGIVRIALTSAAGAAQSPIVPRNVGAQPGERLTDSGNAKILETLKTAHASTVVVVELEDGSAWWETRLLILASGAARLGRPRALVFTATREGARNVFVGWAEPQAVRDRLTGERPDLRRAYQRAIAISSQWDLIEPQQGNPRKAPAPRTSEPPFRQLARGQDGLQGPFKEEQILSATLADVESSESGEPANVTAKGLEALLDSVLHTRSIDETSDDAQWLKAMISTEDDYMALTNRREYIALMSRAAITNSVLSALAA